MKILEKVDNFKVWHIKSKLLRKVFILVYVPCFVILILIASLMYAVAGFWENFVEFSREHLLDTGFFQNMKICWQGGIPMKTIQETQDITKDVMVV